MVIPPIYLRGGRDWQSGSRRRASRRGLPACRRPRIPSAYMTCVSCPACIHSAHRAAYICTPARSQARARGYRFVRFSSSRWRAGRGLPARARDYRCVMFSRSTLNLCLVSAAFDLNKPARRPAFAHQGRGPFSETACGGGPCRCQNDMHKSGMYPFLRPGALSFGEDLLVEESALELAPPQLLPVTHKSRSVISRLVI